jgi:hypothetical protein
MDPESSPRTAEASAPNLRYPSIRQNREKGWGRNKWREDALQSGGWWVAVRGWVLYSGVDQWVPSVGPCRLSPLASLSAMKEL